MKAILIDPFDCTVSRVEYDGNYRSIYKLIGCECFTCIEIDGGRDVLYVDDEGLFNDAQAFWSIDGYLNPLAGRGLILGNDAATGDSCAASIEPGDVFAKVKFLSPKSAAEKHNAANAARREWAAQMRAEGFNVIEASPDLEYDDETGEAKA